MTEACQETNSSNFNEIDFLFLKRIFRFLLFYIFLYFYKFVKWNAGELAEVCE
jgi:hypothetical protein